MTLHTLISFLVASADKTSAILLAVPVCVPYKILMFKTSLEGLDAEGLTLTLLPLLLFPLSREMRADKITAMINETRIVTKSIISFHFNPSFGSCINFLVAKRKTKKLLKKCHMERLCFN